MTTHKIDFFDLSTNNNEPLRTDIEFGLCDDHDNDEQHTEPAYSDNDIDKKDTHWIAIVKNSKQTPVRFYALDNRIAQPEGQGMCDGMLQVNEFDALHLVELKDKRKRWFAGSQGQLEDTIKFMKHCHMAELGCFRHKYAHACNKKHPNFNRATTSEKEEFREKTGFILQTTREIVISS